MTCTVDGPINAVRGDGDPGSTAVFGNLQITVDFS